MASPWSAGLGACRAQPWRADLQTPGAAADGGNDLLAPSRVGGPSTPTIHVGSLAEGDRVPGHRKFAAFVRAPEGNGCAERFIRTLKANLLWVQHFETIEERRQALIAFRGTCNTTWLIERLRFIPPQAVRQNQLQPAARAAQASARRLRNRGR